MTQPTLDRIARNKLLQSIADIDTTTSFAAEDALRAFQEQSKLLAITEKVRSSFAAEHVAPGWKVEVTDYENVSTRDDYVLCLTTVSLEKEAGESQHQRPKLELFFRYERRPGDSPTVSYAIDIATTNKIRQNILWIHIWAAGDGYTGPTTKCVLLPPLTVVAGVDAPPLDGVTTKDSEDSASEKPAKKKQKRETEKGTEDSSESNTVDDASEDVDRYTAGIDPEVFDLLAPAMTLDVKQTEEYGNICSFLLSFPLYEVEWDLPGLMFDALFEGEDDETSLSDEPK